jgi:hypothetical protein
MKKKQKVIIWLVVAFILLASFFLFLEKSKMMSMPIVSDLQDSIIEKQWSHGEILKEETGSIYTLGEDGKLAKFNIGLNKWEKIESPHIQSERWGISKAFLACFVSGSDMVEGKISLFSMPDFKLLNTISVSKDHYYLPMLYPDKNGKYVAVIASKRMGIFSIENGAEVFKVEYDNSYVIDTVDWSYDSSKILFSIFDKSSKSKSESMPFVNVYDLNSKTSEKICQGWGPKWDSGEDRIIFRKSEYNYSYGDIFEFNRKTQKEKLLLRNIRLYDYGWSPSGNNLFVAIPQRVFSLYHWPQWLTVVNYGKPNLRFIVLVGLNSTGNSNERFFWVDN